MFNKKLWISVALAFVLFMSGLLGFVIIPNALGKFKAVSLMPTTLDSVSGNGGPAVMVGEYLYFTNGFVSKNNVVYKQNNYNASRTRGQGDGGIWRVKMTDGTPNYDNSYLDYLSGDFDPQQREVLENFVIRETGNKRKDNLELIVPKVAGWEDTAIWIFGNNLIYTSPNNQKDKHGQLRRNRTDFYRVNLNGSGHRHIYTTRNENITRDQYTVAWAGGKNGEPYLLIHDGGQINRVSMNGKVHTAEKNAETSVMPTVTTYIQSYHMGADGKLTLGSDGGRVSSYQGIMGNVFYTLAPDDEDAMTGNAVWRFDIANGTTHKVVHNENYHVLLALGNGHLMMETQFQTPSSHRELYAINNIANFPPVATGELSHIDWENDRAILISGKSTSTSDFRYITHSTDGRLFVYDRNGNCMHPDGIPGVYDVAEIIAVNASNIMYVSNQSNEQGTLLVSVDYNGNQIFAEASPNMADGARLGAFCVLNALGQPGSFMFFYIDTLTEVDDHDHEHGDDCDHGAGATLTVGVIARPNATGGKTHYLTRLNGDYEKFLYLPEKDDN